MKKTVFIAMTVLCLAGCQKEVQQAAKVYGRYVPERKDDFAWENEYAAFRMYGAALKPENPSNGVDLWLKNSPALVIDTMYGRELKDHRPYHINYDGNLDCYKVGHTCGAGGMVVLTKPEGEDAYRTWIGGPYDRWEVLEQTSNRFVFRLEYDSLLVEDKILQYAITVTAEAGEPLNRADIVIQDVQSDKVQSVEMPELLVGGGIYMHDTIDHFEVYSDSGIVYYEEDALSDKQAAKMNYDYNGSTSQGRIYITVRTPGATVTDIKDGNLIAVRPYQLGDTLTYWFGACWSEWNGENAK